VHAAADAVADERAHDGEPGALGGPLDRARDVAHALSGAALGDARVQRLLGPGQQLARAPVDLTHGERTRRIGDPAVQSDADVDRDDVAALEAIGAWDA